jgi:hypothetical protein
VRGGGKKMKNIKLLTIFLVILSILSSFTVVATKEKGPTFGPELKVGVFGASLLGLRKSGFFIYNGGDEPINDIYYTFTFKSVFSDNINFSFSNELDLLKVNSAYVELYPNPGPGFGFVTLSIIVTSSNAGNATDSAYGFHNRYIIISKNYLLAWF